MLAAIVLGLQFAPGATLRIYDIGQPLSELSQLVPGQTPNIDRLIEKVEIKNGEFGIKDHFVAEITAEFNALVAGTYSFKITSDDGSELNLDGKSIAENDGIHPPTSSEGTVNLSGGYHALKLRYFEHEGGEELKLEWKGPGQADYVVADGRVLRVPAGLTRVTSPGTKALMGVGGKRRPGNGMPLTGLHPGWTLTNFRPKDFKPQVGSMAFLPDGRLLIGNFKPNQSGKFDPDLRDGVIYLLDGVTGNDSKKVTIKTFAEGIQEPLGLAVVKDASTPKGYRIYIAQRTEITELTDTDGDDKADQKATVAKAWVSDNYHHFTFGLAEKDGFLYASLSTSITGGAPGINGPNPANRGTVMKIDPRSYNATMPMANVEFLSGGHRTPNGIEIGPHGLVLVGENQGAWQPSNKLNVIVPGGFYGHYNNTTFPTPEYPKGGTPGPYDDQPFTQPGLHLPQNECANSPGQAVTIPDGEFKDQILISDVKYGGLRRAWLEQVAGQWQGGVVQHSQGFEVGTNRMVWGPDGSLYIGGIGATETWAWTDPKTGKWTTFGLQKIKPNGKSTFEIREVRARHDGFLVSFTKPVAAFKPDDIAVRQWNYAPTPEYGGDKKNRETLTVKEIVSVGNNSVLLKIPGLKDNRVVYMNFGVKSSDKKDLWASECWYTMNRVPTATPASDKALVVPNPRLLVFSKTAAFRHDCIPMATEAIKAMGAERGFTVEATEDSSIFTPENLKRFDAVMFLCTTGDILNDAQQDALYNFVTVDGGGFLGVHAAADTEYEWKQYPELIGAFFKRHPAIQQATIKVEDRAHPTTCFLPHDWTRVDEWYDYRANPRPNVRVLMSMDTKSYQNSEMSDDHPISWCNQVGNGRSWYTGLGHTQGTYREKLFMDSLHEAIVWVSQKAFPAGRTDLKWKSQNGWTKGTDRLANETGRADHLVSTEEFGDALIHAEFSIPKDSNSGVYVQGRYEIQILDSFGKPWQELTFADAGAVYQRWKDDQGCEGNPPSRNAIRPPGEWNTYDILFRAPRFVNGKKTENARFVEVRVNGVVVQRDIEVTGPTRASMWEDEKPTGPIMLQGDHGPIAYRNVWVKPWRG